MLSIAFYSSMNEMYNSIEERDNTEMFIGNALKNSYGKEKYLMDIEFSYTVLGFMFLLSGLAIEFKPE